MASPSAAFAWSSVSTTEACFPCSSSRHASAAFRQVSFGVRRETLFKFPQVDLWIGRQTRLGQNEIPTGQAHQQRQNPRPPARALRLHGALLLLAKP